MNNVNWQKQFEGILTKFNKQSINGSKPKVLLHCCCAPCASVCIERLKNFADVTAYFYNPNMDSKAEYLKRADEMVKLADFMDIDVIIEDYRAVEFLSSVVGYENSLEGGYRCSICFNLRLEKTAFIAKEKGFDFFATSLTLSPLKNANKINSIGFDIGKSNGINYLPSDFKKQNGFIRSVELSNALNIYRQNYCGCIFSKNRF